MPGYFRILHVIVATLVFVCFSHAYATEDDAGIFVKNLGNNAISLLTAKGMEDKEREARFRALFRTNFDVERIGRFTLGKYVRRADEHQMTEFLKSFEDFIVITYASRFSEYSGETFTVKSVRSGPGRDTQVLTEVLSPTGGPPYRVDWQVSRKTGVHKITDVKVEGVSMSVTQRAEFGSVIRRHGGLDGLIQRLRSKTRDLSIISK